MIFTKRPDIPPHLIEKLDATRGGVPVYENGHYSAIGDSHHLASDTADVYIAREIPVRPGVIMANRKMAGGDGGCTCWEGYERVPGTEPCASKSCRKKTGARAQKSHRELLA